MRLFYCLDICDIKVYDIDGDLWFSQVKTRLLFEKTEFLCSSTSIR